MKTSIQIVTYVLGFIVFLAIFSQVSCAGNNYFGNRRLPAELTYELTSTVVGHHPDNPLTWYDPVHKVVVGSHLQYRAVFVRVSNPTDQPLTVDADRTGIQVGNVAEPVFMMSTEYYLRCINPAVFPRRYVIPAGGRIDLAIVPFSNFRYNPPRENSEYDSDHPAPTPTTPPSSGTFREKMDLQRGRCDWSRLYRLPPWHKCDEQCVRDFIHNLEGREIRVSLGMERWGEPFSVDYLMRLGKPRIGVNAKPVPPTKPDYNLE